MSSHSILIIACDPYLAGIYGRKFERDNWDVEIAETILDGERTAIKSRPSIILLDDECAADISGEIRRLKSLPTILKTKIVVLAKEGDQKKISESFSAGADDYLLLGHFVPQEAVQKMRKML
ncbi:hypothetical protein CO057_04145 [Candidatus Uhrbacteria bacterium CG_4_9_14_0_2_um_filter_41_50]|uniref:Response regulatory domain-containing protein n=1 Tax=Candidatus Uhrbacteria bacterium CG_4_9_14_0_2_um_filter_41_50 TaxID=1975031 RepID=A0A2M8EN74_9BACT|nr:MAG: hypothetical protein COZ45_00700 [Candidatus Uhrbacteria bacterium CG_4_10_14_3_um_filter_41_21]PIZ54205.1 MAG: hypothetical protein COY24_04655 [Candidatus Uhrbacteria bacterium CG_4_10_14_0_2_um_filter_41_21]PJB84927.1 MAG: hypothetical protein CO086_01010 [Candidatus Uhrbacteria bacterium CG_4_9_14_0_8_um_filter_41_16]PJC24193.1 MAG: hypothetical protein CO057_04145 [Candidatus Uhrbacteria bacterium CG_4_9_14_0_2_um_filter_41_50]PJE74650.1 MAG: hypothetical protein COV03_04395 [Candi